jgi:DMSO/TMAO reductase YedYZ molybdopterin-dependent catalytic subunit
MQKPSYRFGAVLGGLTSLLLIAMSYLGQQLADLPFIPFDLFDWLARVLPGNVISLGIDTMVRLITSLGLGSISATAKLLEQLQGLLLVVISGVVFGVILTWVVRHSTRSAAIIGATGGSVVFVLVGAIELNLATAIARSPVLAFLWLALLTVGWGLVLGLWLGSAPVKASAPAAQPATAQSQAPLSRSRRVFFREVGTLLAAAFAAWGIGWLVENQRHLTAVTAPNINTTPEIPLTGGEAAATTVTPPAAGPGPAAGSVSPVLGTRSALTPIADFYRIDIDTIPPAIDSHSWALQVSGLFDRPRPLTLTELRAYPAITQPATMSCISNPVGGDLISTANWTGAPLHLVLADLGLRPEAKALNIKAADGFYESVTLEDLQDPRTLLVYAMNDQPLTGDHGYPLRIYIPDRYGMKQPKWITSIEATTERANGYWVDRGWSLEARPQIVSVIDRVTPTPENGVVPIGGIAWAGARGIRKVEVQVDNGSWAEATLITPPLGPLTWVQWRYDWPAGKGTYTFIVRATDGTGTLQDPTFHDTAPDGATGYDSVTATF